MKTFFTSDAQPPICVDLDGTLVKIDTLHQALLLLIRRDPKTILKIPKWIRKGRAVLKDEVMQRIFLDVPFLPYNKQLLSYLREEKEKGRKIILVTGANIRVATAVANHLNIFDEIMASSSSHNLFGSEKTIAIQKKYKAYDYAGDSIYDLPAFEKARKKIFVNPSRLLSKHKSDILIEERHSLLKSIFESFRISQWTKNILIFLPALLAHQLNNNSILFSSLITFLSFSLTASAIYILNDLLDISADQHHPRKRNRPFANGNLQLIQGIYFIPILLISSFLILQLLPNSNILSRILMLYTLLAISYSLKLKQIIFVDVIILTLFYNIRIIMGGFATYTSISDWFFFFTLFLFLNLALLKRFASIVELKEENTFLQERGYTKLHKKLLLYSGITTGLASCFILLMYSFSDQINFLYSKPFLIHFTSPVLMYWLIKMWRSANKNMMRNDPFVYASQDIISYIVCLAIGLLFFLAL